jgi:hypothetical protein
MASGCERGGGATPAGKKVARTLASVARRLVGNSTTKVRAARLADGEAARSPTENHGATARQKAMQKGMNGWLRLPLAQNAEQLKGAQGCSFNKQPQSQDF